MRTMEGGQGKKVYGTRTWTSVSGAKLEAMFEGFRVDMVSLRKTDGVLVSILISKLSAADQSLVRQWSSAAL